MKTLDIEHVEKELETVAKYYMEDILKDRLGGALREWFDNALERRGMQGVVEIPRPAQACTTVGDVTYKIKRLVMPTREVDADLMRVDAHDFIEAIHKDVDDYVAALPADTVVVNVPALYVSARAYMVKWFVWGYFGTPVGGAGGQAAADSKATTDKQGDE